MEDLMLATSNKMTGLDLASRPAETKRSMTDEMLSTPKIPDSAGSSLMSPRFLAYSTSSYSSSSRSGNGFSSSGHGDGATNGSSSTAANKGGNSDDMLMTPVLTTPNTADVWSGRRAAEAVDFSPENLSSTADLDLGSREPPKDLPMDSDIGLRSPCDGLLAKRRKQMREMSKRGGSFNSDSNSCDTPTSENSPRDLTTGPPRNGSAASTETDLARKLNNNRHSSPVPEHSPTIAKRGLDPSSPRPPPPLLPPPTLSDDRRYKEFKRPANLTNINGVSAKENDIPAHYTPSPLAVPSPNWSVVERYFGGEMIKTPKNLDTSNVFDFLGLPPPSTPRSKLYRDRSPNNPVGDCYSGRDQRLSPRLSPRFPIPEAPTDLSGRPPPLARVSDLIANEAEDLSTRSSKARSSPQNRPQVETPLSMIPTILQHPVADPTPPVKMEYDRSPPRVTPPPAPTTSSSMHMVTVKTENPMGMGPPPTAASDYDYCAHVPHIPTPPAPCFPNSFYLSSGFHPSYHRQVYGHPELERPSPPRTASPPRSMYERTGGYHQPWPGMQSHHHQLHHHQQHHQQQLHHQQHHLQQHHDLHSHGSSGGGLMINSHSWTTPIKEEPSISPPPPSSSAPPSHYSSMNSNLSIKSNHLLDGLNDRKRSPRKTSNDSNEMEEKRGRKKGGKAKANKEQANTTAPGESKRVYTCPHCQRAYDWNYNLNRHLKYECGKENAFQCAKCSRKFPHKQNCVYHLKRKHKIIYDTIDQYMSAGLVIFRGASDPTGHIEARPVPYGAN